MSEALVWDQIGEREYETGVDKTALFPMSGSSYGKGVAWNGVTQITESPSGGEPTSLYADNIKYLTMYSLEEKGGTIECYTYPDEFKPCNGEAALTTGVTVGQQTRKAFGLAFETIVGNDTDGDDHGRKLHLIYGCKVKPSEETHQTVNDSPSASTLSYEFSTTPVAVTDHKATSSVVIDSTEVGDTAFKAIEKVVYGSTDADARLPLPDEVKSIIDEALAGE